MTSGSLTYNLGDIFDFSLIKSKIAERAARTFEVELHAHPIGLKRYGLENIIDIAKKNNLDAVALEDYNDYIFPELVSMSKTLEKKYKIEFNRDLIKISDNKSSFYIFNAVELMTKEGFHIIGLGHSYYKEGESIHKILKSDFTIIDHPTVDAEYPYQKIGYEKSKELVNICQKYPKKIALEWNAYCLNYIWYFLDEDVNKITEKFADLNNLPVVADTDLHGWNKRLMEDLGKSRIKLDYKDIDMNISYLVPSIKQAILDKKHENVKRYVSFPHFIEAFGIPIVLNNIHSAINPHVRGNVKR